MICGTDCKHFLLYIRGVLVLISSGCLEILDSQVTRTILLITTRLEDLLLFLVRNRGYHFTTTGRVEDPGRSTQDWKIEQQDLQALSVGG